LFRDGDGKPDGPETPQVPPAVVIGAAFLAGSIPFSNLMARRVRRVDLRDVGTGTVSGTALYRVAGFGPLALAGVCDVAKGAVGPLLAGSDRPELAAVAGGVAVAGHNWSPWLGGAGGRGISPALGAFLPYNWPGTVVLLTGMVAGKFAGETAIGALLADAALVPVLTRVKGRHGRWAATAVLVPMLAKRLLGNRPARGRPQVYLWRLLLDRDEPGRGERDVPVAVAAAG
jgi:glycerol-3-phosphate acyltransferase PlsY